MMRRDFLKGAGAAVSIPLAASVRTWPAIGSNRIDIPSQIKSFDIDFNWLYDPTTKRSQFAPPGHWADANPEEHIRWYGSLGANVVQTFAVSCNGYAWYKHGFVPPAFSGNTRWEVEATWAWELQTHTNRGRDCQVWPGTSPHHERPSQPHSESCAYAAQPFAGL
jgi:hypothetical protein